MEDIGQGIHTRGVCKVCDNYRQVLIPSTGKCLYCTPGTEVQGQGADSRVHLPNLKAKRKEEGLTLQDLSEVTGLALSTISMIENGHHASLPMAKLLAEALWCSLEDLGAGDVKVITKGTRIMRPRNQKGKNGWSQPVAQ